MISSALLKILFLIFIDLANASSYQDIALSLANIPEDGRLDFCELARKYKYKCTPYIVTTEDGYKLKVFNVKGDSTDSSKPVLCQHGIFDSSDAFMLKGLESWVALLVNNSYDVWLGNMRGNKYCQSHVSLDPDSGPNFWEFSFHEIALYDLTATIDFILDTTNQTQLQAIGHSQGTTVFFVLGSEKPEYNYKVKSLICLSPVAYLDHTLSPLGPLLSAVGNPAVSVLLGNIAHGEILSNSSELTTVLRVVCTQGLVGREICYDGFFSALFGYDPEQVDTKMFQTFVAHYPAGSSLRNLAHHVQNLTRKKFAKYDYGPIKNLKKYNSTEPPDYDLSKCTMKIDMTIGKNDKLSVPVDTQRLRKQLPYVANYYVIPYQMWNHADFVLGKYLPKYLYKYVLEKLKQYY